MCLTFRAQYISIHVVFFYSCIQAHVNRIAYQKRDKIVEVVSITAVWHGEIFSSSSGGIVGIAVSPLEETNT